VFSKFFSRLASGGLTVRLNCISMGGEGRYITLTKNYCIFPFIQEKGFKSCILKVSFWGILWAEVGG